MTHEEQFTAYQKQIEEFLHDYLDGVWPFGKLADAMSYSLLSGGKRIRPVLTLAACRFCFGEAELALPLAGALEMVHTYSLIHDDLPCMDDDDLRRGKPTNHRVFGQATATLAGDALLTSAFEVLAKAPGLSDGQRVAAVSCLAQAAGPAGMVAGQILDMDASGHKLNATQIEKIEALKTGELLVAAVRLGAIAAGGEQSREEALAAFAKHIGLAFQIQDDLLDVVGQEVELGKPIGSDQSKGKATFVSLLGVDACEKLVEDHTNQALAALSPYKENEFLCWVAEMLARRRK